MRESRKVAVHNVHLKTTNSTYVSTYQWRILKSRTPSPYQVQSEPERLVGIPNTRYSLTSNREDVETENDDISCIIYDIDVYKMFLDT